MVQANGLMGLGVEQKEVLHVFDRRSAGGRPALDHVALGTTGQPMGIQGEHLSGEVAAGPPQLTQPHLKLAGLLAGVCVEQIVDGAVGGQEG